MWILPPSLSCPSAPESEGSTSDSSSLFPLLERFAWWRGKPSPSRLWAQRWKRVTWMPAQFGRTLVGSTAKRGVASWIASWAVTRASRSASPVPEQGLKTHAICSHTLPESWERCALPWCSSRTSMDIFPLDSERSDSDYRTWATSLRQAYSRRKRSAPPISESGSSYWPTTTVGYSKASGWGWHKTEENSTRHSGTTLTDAAVRQWPTPISRDHRSGMVSETTASKNARPLSEVACFRQDPTTSTPGAGSNPQLNPRFVEWLMGVPLGWTDFEPLETGSFLSWQRMHSARLQEMLDSHEPH